MGSHAIFTPGAAASLTDTTNRIPPPPNIPRADLSPGAPGHRFLSLARYFFLFLSEGVLVLCHHHSGETGC